MSLFRACDCSWHPCAHNPHPEFIRVRKRLEELKRKPWWQRIFLFEAMLHLKADLEYFHWKNVLVRKRDERDSWSKTQGI